MQSASSTYRVVYKGENPRSDFGEIYIKLVPRIENGLRAHGTLLSNTHSTISAHVRSYLWFNKIPVCARDIVWRNLTLTKCTPDT